jgi:DNA-binding transcriptional regulator GbsR (MarR family)
MANQSKASIKHFHFEGRMREIEKSLVDYHLDIARASQKSNKAALLLAYLSIHGQLTQRQLKQLTKFSISTVSTQLAILVESGYVQREMIKGTHEYFYSSVYFAPVETNQAFDEVLGSLNPEIRFLNELIAELNLIGNAALKGYRLLSARLNETLRVFEFYEAMLKVLEDPQQSLDIEAYKVPSKKLTRQDLLSSEEDFSPAMKKIEDKLLTYFLHQSSYAILKRYHLMIYVYFITRKVLTQDLIKRLTGISRGKISQSLKFLIKREFIEEIDRDLLLELLPERTTRKLYYAMPSYQRSFLVTGRNSLADLLKWKSKFLELKEELECDKSILKGLRGYNQIVKAVESYLRVMPMYQLAFDFFSDLISQL